MGRQDFCSIAGCSDLCHKSPVGKPHMAKKFTDDELMMPAFHPDFMLLANYKGEVVAISFQSGQTKWAADLPAAPTTSPVVLKKTCFIGTEGGSWHTILKV